MYCFIKAFSIPLAQLTAVVVVNEPCHLASTRTQEGGKKVRQFHLIKNVFVTTVNSSGLHTTIYNNGAGARVSHPKAPENGAERAWARLGSARLGLSLRKTLANLSAETKS